MGLQGPQGPQGKQGPQGLQGPPGPGGLATTLDVTLSGCTPPAIPNDGADDAPAFACALSLLAPRGGTLHVPAGTFDLGSTLTLPDHVSLVGDGFGSILHQLPSLTAPVLVTGHETAVRHLQLTQDQPAPGAGWAPDARYDFQIEVQKDASTVEDVMLRSPYKGILVAPPAPTGAVGQILVSNVKGQPLAVGIQADHVLDVIHIEKIHFWPFWSQDPRVIGWTEANGIGIESLRVDNPQLAQLFFFGYQTGILFGQSSCAGNCGITSKAKVAEMDCDFCAIGVHVTGAGTRGLLLDQLSVQGTGAAGLGLFVEADSVSALLTEGDFTNLAANAVRVLGSYEAVSVTNTMVRDWNESGMGFPAFEWVQGSGRSWYLSAANSVTGNGHGAPLSSPGVVLSNVQGNVNL